MRVSDGVAPASAAPILAKAGLVALPPIPMIGWGRSLQNGSSASAGELVPSAASATDAATKRRIAFEFMRSSPFEEATDGHAAPRARATGGPGSPGSSAMTDSLWLQNLVARTSD